MRWTGNGLPDGTLITTTPMANTAGNGDTVARAVTGTSTLTTRGDGFEYTGSSSSLGRFDILSASSQAYVFQFFYTPGIVPTGGIESVLYVCNSSLTRIFSFVHQVSNFFYPFPVTGSPPGTPVTPLNNRYQVDVILALSAVPTTTNGRYVVKVRNLTNPSWNTTGEFFVDSGYSVNLGTTDIAGVAQAIRYGKNNTGDLTGGVQLLEQIGWNPITVNPADLSRAKIEPYFMASPYTANVGWLGA